MGMAQTMVKREMRVAGYDINPTAVVKLVDAGGTSALSLAEAANGAGALLVVVVNAAQTDAVLFGNNGAAHEMKHGGVIVSSATMAPDDARHLAAKAEALGMHYLDAPISGGAAKAAIGQLTMMASGTHEAFQPARPVLNAIATTVYELGDAAGIGAYFKMVNQLLAGVHIAAACAGPAIATRIANKQAEV